jgi:CrcB protein
MLMYLWVAFGSAFGGVARFWLSGVVASTKLGGTFPLGTLVINITGCFIIGFFNTATGTEGRWLVSPAARTFFMIGGLVTLEKVKVIDYRAAENPPAQT